MGLAAWVERAVRGAGVAVDGVSIGAEANKATWRVTPTALQGAAQTTIDGFNAADPAHPAAELDAQVTTTLDQERLISAVIWAVIDTYSAPATRAKYLNARGKIVTAYKDRPWLP